METWACSVQSFPSEVCGYFSPLPGVPFEDGSGVGVLAQPFLGAFYQLEKLLGLGVAGKLGFAFLLFYPTDGIDAVAVNRHIETFLFQQGKAVDYGKKFSDVVSAVHRAEVKNLLAAGNVYSPIFHCSGVAAACGIYGKAVLEDGSRIRGVDVLRLFGRLATCGCIALDVVVR